MSSLAGENAWGLALLGGCMIPTNGRADAVWFAGTA